MSAAAAIHHRLARIVRYRIGVRHSELRTIGVLEKFRILACQLAESAMMDAEPTSIRVVDVMRSRLPDLELLRSAMAADAAFDQDWISGEVAAGAGGQARHLRRRTTSHKPRGMPPTLKRRRGAEAAAARAAADGAGGADAAASSGRAACRKSRRRPALLLAEHWPHAEPAPPAARARRAASAPRAAARAAAGSSGTPRGRSRRPRPRRRRRRPPRARRRPRRRGVA